ncbi:hypothetical protein ACFU7Y_40620, partial [Kitasatospora sp. NPDC057542]|uniref:hypothetical protein n=1 Tax=Kitasatospora sp. NPDC057542 TaxID=3346162 RepID=UPI0036834EAD
PCPRDPHGTGPLTVAVTRTSVRFVELASSVWLLGLKKRESDWQSRERRGDAVATDEQATNRRRARHPGGEDRASAGSWPDVRMTVHRCIRLHP